MEVYHEYCRKFLKTYLTVAVSSTCRVGWAFITITSSFVPVTMVWMGIGAWCKMAKNFPIGAHPSNRWPHSYVAISWGASGEKSNGGPLHLWGHWSYGEVVLMAYTPLITTSYGAYEFLFRHNVEMLAHHRRILGKCGQWKRKQMT